MNVASEEFNLHFGEMRKNGEYLINQIKLKEGQREFDLVLDIGSGSGNMTLLMASSINCKQLIGLDIDSQMIEFAKQHHKRENIDYLQCDVELPWDQLSDEVKQLEGRCSLIYSNNVLDFIRDIDECAQNLSRLLAPSGRIYVCTFPFDDFLANRRLSIEANDLTAAIPLLQAGNSNRSWKEAMTNSGLRLEVTQEFVNHYAVTKGFLEKFFVPISYELLVKQADTDEKRRLVDEYKDRLPELVYSCMTVDDERQLFRFDLKTFFFVAKK